MLFESWIPNNTEKFKGKVIEVSSNLGIQPDWLMGVMFSESRLKPDIVNKVSGATGLIQFMPSTASGLGTTTAALKKMSNVDQLDYVEKYFYPYRNKINSYEDLYMITFFPAAMGKPDSYVLKTSSVSAAKIASQNKIFDLNKNGEITAGEVRKAFTKRLENLNGVVTTAKETVKKYWIPMVGISLAVGLLAYISYVSIRKKKITVIPK